MMPSTATKTGTANNGPTSLKPLAATPSATLSVALGEETLARVRWGEVEAAGSLEPSPRLRIEVIDPERNWVRTSVVDDETQQKIDVVKQRLIKYFGYNETSATDVLNYVASIFARGDSKQDE